MPDPKKFGLEPDLITNHKFVPKGEWWSLCKECNLSEAAHAESDVEHILPQPVDREVILYHSDEVEEV